jgi:uncharacterized DUF497 family protein
LQGRLYWGYNKSLKLIYDPRKRALTLRERGLDFEEARHVFRGREVTIVDNRFDYGEVRYSTYGYLRSRLVNVVWTLRAGGRRIISMRYCHDKEVKAFKAHLD